MTSEQQQEEEKKSLRVEILTNLSRLMAGGLGLVAALAWNDAIKSFFNRIFQKPEDNLMAMFGYAVVVTFIVVAASIYIGKATDVAKKSLDKRKKMRKTKSGQDSSQVVDRTS